jgi:glutamate 5-kinase
MNESSSTKQPLFPLGQVVATPGALTALLEAGQSPLVFLVRHVTGDWGELDAEDIQENEYSLQHGLRLFSAYKTAKDEKLWVITEWDRSVTTLLLPSEY